MSLLADVKTFITDHEPHGELTGDAGEVTRSGYRLWITCPCGVTFERIAEPVGICISRQVFDQVSRALKADSQALGPRTLKNIAQPVDVFSIAPTDRGAGPGVTAPMPSPQAGGLLLHRARRSPVGVPLAHSMIGEEPPLVKTGNWMTRLEFDLESPIWRHLYRELAKDHPLIRYDGALERSADAVGPGAEGLT